jgi:hypothetical protein
MDFTMFQDRKRTIPSYFSIFKNAKSRPGFDKIFVDPCDQKISITAIAVIFFFLFSKSAKNQNRDTPTVEPHPNNLDQSLNDAATEKIRKYRADYNNRSPSVVSFMPVIASTSDRVHSEFVRLLFLQAHRETDRFFATSGVQSAQSTSVFHFRRAAFLLQLKSKVGLTLANVVALRIVLNLDGAPIASKSHTHPSHSQTSRLLTSSLSLGLPVPRPTQCVRVT